MCYEAQGFRMAFAYGQTCCVIDTVIWRLEGDLYCVLCQDREEETLHHLFFACTFSWTCWNIIGINWVDEEDIQNKVEREHGHNLIQDFVWKSLSLMHGAFGSNEMERFSKILRQAWHPEKTFQEWTLSTCASSKRGSHTTHFLLVRNNYLILLTPMGT